MKTKVWRNKYNFDCKEEINNDFCDGVSKFEDGQVLNPTDYIKRALGNIGDTFVEGVYEDGDHDSVDMEEFGRLDHIDREVQFQSYVENVNAKALVNKQKALNEEKQKKEAELRMAEDLEKSIQKELKKREENRKKEEET